MPPNTRKNGDSTNTKFDTLIRYVSSIHYSPNPNKKGGVEILHVICILELLHTLDIHFKNQST